jgi:hypothetical protein
MCTDFASENMILCPGIRKLFLYATFAIYVCAHPDASAQDQRSAPQTPRSIHRAVTIDDQLKTLTQHLDLDATQQSMVKIILQRRHAELRDVFRNDSLSAVDRFNAVKDVHERANDRIAHILNPEQAKKFDQMRSHTPANNLPKPDVPTPPRV